MTDAARLIEKSNQPGMVGDRIGDLIGSQRPGWSLEQDFYLDPAIFKAERKLLFPTQWIVVGHVSELARVKDHIVRRLYDEEILIVRAGDTDFRAFFNVCTHRGSRICKADGRAPTLVCPYHAWSFKLTGELITVQDLPADADPEQLGLHAVPLQIIGGLILCGLDPNRLPDTSAAAAALEPALRRHGFETARILARRSYPTNANWKLVMENFFECYHCRPSHPEYFSVNGHVSMTAVRDPVAAAHWEAELNAWRAEMGEGEPVKDVGDIDRMAYSIYRQPIGNGRSTLSRTGEPVSRLMGEFTAYDGGETAFHFGRQSFASATNDFITLVQIMPVGPELTEVVFTWLVHPEADVPDVEDICWMWDVTTIQDKRIVEENAAGVHSSAYRPGPYTALEGQTSRFVQTYLSEMSRLLQSDA